MHKNSLLLGPLLESFFYERLLAQQHVSPHTLSSYRDTIRLMLAYIYRQTGRPPSQQTLEDWNAQAILHFLDYLERERHCQARTRNARLAALRAFIHYLEHKAPETLSWSAQVLAIPIKRYERPLLHPLSTVETEAILSATEPTPSGRRDHLLLNFLLHTGARISEALQLREQDIQWGPPSTVCLHGKGRKERVLPLLNPLRDELKRTLSQSSHQPSALVFRNYLGQPLTRFGVDKRLHQTVQRASHSCPSLVGRKVSAHLFRHTVAARLLQAGVDIMVIALILGHQSPNTTHHYTELDLSMKDRCLRKVASPKSKKGIRFKASDAVLQFLNNL